MKIKQVMLVASIVCFCVVSLPLYSQEVEFNYEGRVKVDGSPYTGEGYFKFAIVNPNGQITYWSNDATSTGGSEPAAAVVTDVTDGVFNVVIGDTSLMDPLDASIFNGDENVFLKVWFSDAPTGFEHLRPNRRITNPALLGSQSFREIHLYVDVASGDDAYPGTSPAHPKETIQAAWDALPPMLRRSATIHLEGGVYREEVLLSGKTAIGNATISIVGNISDPSLVRVTGANEGADITAVRHHAFVIKSQDNLFVKGILFDYCYDSAVLIDNNAVVDFSHCQLLNNYLGFLVTSSQFTGQSLEIGDGNPTQSSTTRGIYATFLAKMILRNCSIHDVSTGVNATCGVVIREIGDCTIDSCNYGVHVGFSNVVFVILTGTNTISNCSSGVVATGNSALSYPNTNVTYINTTPAVVLNNGSVSND